MEALCGMDFVSGRGVVWFREWGVRRSGGDRDVRGGVDDVY